MLVAVKPKPKSERYMKIKAKKESGKKAEKKTSAAVTAPVAQPDGERTKVPLHLLTPHDDLPPMRDTDEEHVAELKQSIRKNGLDVPLIVWDGGDPDYMMEVPGMKGEYPATFLVAGYNRREALTQLSKDDPSWFKKEFGEGIPVVRRSGDLKSAIAAQLRENIGRKDADRKSIIKAFNRLIGKEFGMKPSEIAKAIGKSKSWVSGILDVKKHLKGGLEAVEKGEADLQATVDAARDVKKKVKAGVKVNKKKVLAKVKAKTADKKAKGKKRSSRGMSAKAVYKAFIGLPSMKLGKQLEIATKSLAYLAGEGKLPEELQSEE
jgi:ParB-like chromosome segregation protein Spo0J